MINSFRMCPCACIYIQFTPRKIKQIAQSIFIFPDFSSNITEKARHDLREIPMTYLDPTSRYDFCIGVRLANNRTVYSDVQSLEYQGKRFSENFLNGSIFASLNLWKAVSMNSVFHTLLIWFLLSCVTCNGTCTRCVIIFIT